VAGVTSVRAFRASSGVQDFWQIEFGPAVLLACGQGYRNPAVTQIPELLAFLQLKADRFDCASLPSPVPLLPQLGHFHRTSRYLESTIAWVWRFSDLSWSSLIWYGGILYGSVTALAYAIARVVLGRGLSLVVTTAVLVSALNLAILPHYRDYAKAPFMLAMILIMARLVVAPADARRVTMLAAAGGAVAGIGLGFRNDVLITVPPFIICVLLLTPWNLPRRWRTRLTALGAAVLAFTIVGFPVIADYSRGSNTPHVVLLGLGKPFDDRLGVTGSLYEFGLHYYDYWAMTAIDSYARRIEGRPNGVALGTPEYDRASTAYLTEIAARFPGDLWTRAVAAVRRMPAFFLQEYQVAPAWVRSRLVHRFYYARSLMAKALAPLALPAIAIALGLIAARSLRYALFASMILVILVGGAAIQFNERHFFYLEVVVWCALVSAVRAAVVIAQRRWPAELSLSPLQGAAFLLAVMAVGAGVFWLTRAYQDREVRTLLRSYLDAPTADATPATASDVVASLHTQVLKIQFDGRRCATADRTLHVRYRSGLPNDFSHRVGLPSAPGEQPVTLFVPVYTRGNDLHFAGIDMAEATRPCVTSIAEVANIAALPLLLDVTLPADWQERPLHQRLAWW
jgi:hypothetical protein